jgi:hypothetical protein
VANVVRREARIVSCGLVSSNRNRSELERMWLASHVRASLDFARELGRRLAIVARPALARVRVLVTQCRGPEARGSMTAATLEGSLGLHEPLARGENSGSHPEIAGSRKVVGGGGSHLRTRLRARNSLVRAKITGNRCETGAVGFSNASKDRHLGS